MAYLNHHHCEGENVCFLARYSLIQDLWRSPSGGMTVLSCVARPGIQVFSDHGEAKIHKTCVARSIHEDVLLDTGHYDEIRIGTTTYPFEVCVNHIARVEVTEAVCNVG